MTIQEVQISCINKSNRYSPSERIESIGGINADGLRWKLTIDQAINFIQEGIFSFYVFAAGKRANVIIASHEGRKYLKTVADGLIPDNLLSLPECPR